MGHRNLALSRLGSQLDHLMTKLVHTLARCSTAAGGTCRPIGNCSDLNYFFPRLLRGGSGISPGVSFVGTQFAGAATLRGPVWEGSK
jgi:hypothetical protein